MKTEKEIRQARRQALYMVREANRSSYYKGMLQALNWMLGEKELLTPQDAENLSKSIQRIMQNKL